MMSCRIKIFCLIAIVSFLFGSGLCRAGYDYIDITDPFLRKIPIAIPSFNKVSTGDATEQLSKTASDLLSETLEFTGYFKILDRDAFLVNMQTETSFANVNFHNWTSIGAELLVTGGVLIQSNMVEMEFRLYDTFKEKLLVGKRYKGLIKDQRKIVRRFCSEIIFILTGDKGIFNSEIAFVSTSSGNKEIYICEFVNLTDTIPGR